MASEVMSFGSLSRLYEGMADKDQRQVSERYELPHFVLRSWLRSLSFIRNICAHHSRLWNRALAIAPVMPLAKHGWLPNEIPNQKRLFVVLVMLRHLMNGQHSVQGWQGDATGLIEPIAADYKFKIVMGLPDNWQTHRRWQSTSGGKP
jgi:abortive infection bacteriophage resistance protein